jgi:hypothetical protein
VAIAVVIDVKVLFLTANAEIKHTQTPTYTVDNRNRKATTEIIAQRVGYNLQPIEFI